MRLEPPQFLEHISENVPSVVHRPQDNTLVHANPRRPLPPFRLVPGSKRVDVLLDGLLRPSFLEIIFDLWDCDERYGSILDSIRKAKKRLVLTLPPPKCGHIHVASQDHRRPPQIGSEPDLDQ